MTQVARNLTDAFDGFLRETRFLIHDRDPLLMIPLGENHLRASVRSFVAHYHTERNHQELDNELLCPAREMPETDGGIRCRERLGGMLRYYYREAA